MEGKGLEGGMDWSEVKSPVKGFGNIGKALEEAKESLKNKMESGIIKGVKTDTGAYGIGRRIDSRDVSGNRIGVKKTLNSGAVINFRQYRENPGTNDWNEVDRVVNELNNPPSGKWLDTKIMDGITDEIINGGLYDVETGKVVRGYFDEKKWLIVSSRNEVTAKTITMLSFKEVAKNQWHEIGHVAWKKLVEYDVNRKEQFYNLMVDAFRTGSVDRRKESTDIEEFFCNRFRDYYQEVDKLNYIDEKINKLQNKRSQRSIVRFFDSIMESD